MSDRIDSLIRRWERLKGEKSRWHEHYDDLARVMLPRRIGFSTTTVEGERRLDNNYDGTPMIAARGLANAMGGLLRPSGLPEIEMRTEDDALNDQEEVKAWLGDAKDRLRDAFNNPRARFRQAAGEADQDLVVFGQSVKFVGESRRRNHLAFRCLHLKDATTFFDETGNPEGVFIHRRLPLRHVVELFGERSLSAESRKTHAKTPDHKIQVLQAVQPRENGRADALFARDMPIAELWIELDAKHILSEGGFHEMPFVVARWDTSSGEDQGRSPGMIALPDADTLQAMGETILIAGQRAADPPLMAPNDGSFDAVHTFPGGLSYYDVETAVAVRGNPFFPLESGTNLPITRDMQHDTRQQIFAAFFRNVLNLPVEGPQMTATEVIQRKEEFIREIGPVFGRLESDDTAPTVERAFMLMLRGGGFAPIPDALAGANVVFEYDSPVKRIKDQIDAAAARKWALEMFEIGQIRPEAIDLPNVDGIGRFTAKALGLPEDAVNSVEVVQQIRAARAEAQAAAAEAQAAAQVGQALGDVAGAMGGQEAAAGGELAA